MNQLGGADLPFAELRVLVNVTRLATTLCSIAVRRAWSWQLSGDNGRQSIYA